MAEATAPPPPARKGKKALLGLILAIFLGGAGFYLGWAGLVMPDGGEDPVVALPQIAFVQVDPLIISLGSAAQNRHLRFSSQLEVATAHQADVALLLPRISDVMNGYLRALDATGFDDPAALVRLRAQLLRRIQIVTGEGRVRDLLVTEFVLN